MERMKQIKLHYLAKKEQEDKKIKKFEIREFRC